MARSTSSIPCLCQTDFQRRNIDPALPLCRRFLAYPRHRTPPWRGPSSRDWPDGQLVRSACPAVAMAALVLALMRLLSASAITVHHPRWHPAWQRSGSAGRSTQSPARGSRMRAQHHRFPYLGLWLSRPVLCSSNAATGVQRPSSRTSSTVFFCALMPSPPRPGARRSCGSGTNQACRGTERGRHRDA